MLQEDEGDIQAIKSLLAPMAAVVQFEPPIMVQQVGISNDCESVIAIAKGSLLVSHEYGCTILDSCTGATLKAIRLRLESLVPTV